MPAHKKWPPGIRDGSDGSDGIDGSGAKMVAQTPPSTRAGGQDDGSLNKLPQKRIALIYTCLLYTSDAADE